MKRGVVSLPSLFLLFAVSLTASLQNAMGEERGTVLHLPAAEVVGVEGGQQVKGKKWAVIVGVNHYASAITSLKYCVADARGFYAKLISPSGGFQAENIRLLVDDQPGERENPTYANIIAALTKWLSLTEENDLALVYVSAHGVEKEGASYILPRDALPDQPEIVGIPVAFVQKQLQNCKAKRKVLILDTCHSGGKGVAAMGAATDKILDQSSGMATLASCQVGESSYEWDAKGHGVFSFYLMEALSSPEADTDRDGYLSVSEINRYVYLKVKQWAAEHQVSQTPKRKEEVTGEILLTRKPGNVVEKPEVEEISTVATLKLTGAPEGASVSVEGHPRGVLPLDLDIDLGAEMQKTLEVTVQKTGFQTKIYRIKAVRGKTIPFMIGLPKLPEPEKPKPPVTALPGQADNPAGYEFVRIPAGEGVAAFEIGKYVVTVAQFRKFVEAKGYKTTAETQGWSFGYTGSKWDKVNGLNWRFGTTLSDPAQDNHPVVNVSWEDAKAFCEWVGGRLPTDGEWEHAARGGLQEKKYVWGDEWPPPAGSGNFADVTAKRKYTGWPIIEGYDDGYADTSPVGSFKPNGFGLFDMAGNVWQWVDRDEGYGRHGCRGGSFCDINPLSLQVDSRNDDSLYPDYYFGLRVARTQD